MAGRALRGNFAPVCPTCFMHVEITHEPMHQGDKAFNDPDARWVVRCRYCGWTGVTAQTERVEPDADPE